MGVTRLVILWLIVELIGVNIMRLWVTIHRLRVSIHMRTRRGITRFIHDNILTGVAGVRERLAMYDCWCMLLNRVRVRLHTLVIRIMVISMRAGVVVVETHFGR